MGVLEPIADGFFIFPLTLTAPEMTVLLGCIEYKLR